VWLLYLLYCTVYVTLCCWCYDRLGYSIKKQLKEDVLYKDRDSQVNAISETFELVKKPVSTFNTD